MTFASPLWLLALLALPALWWAGRRGGAAPGVRYSVADDAAALGTTGWAHVRWLPGALLAAAFGLGAVALARPQERDASLERSTEGIDVVLALDVSTSMTAEDFVPNRFEAAKAVAAEFVRGRTSDRIGLVVFAAQAYTQAPLTLDYPFLLTMLQEVRMGVIEDGTAIGTALATATARLRDSDAASKVVILLTDGQNNRGQVDPQTAAEAAAALGVKVYAIGVGDEGGAVRGAGPFGGAFFGTAPEVDEEALRAVAQTTGGRYFRATDAQALREIYAAISDLERTEIEETVLLDVRELYPWFLWPALACLVLSVGLSTTRLREVP
ncbi:VWA domain-containing protein [Rubrivirga sp. S365]|uniref:VWA domain-containing protein n=1 Tax=Rubrivirga litoralis TaxID=3075598 RepID=A0ABU3BSY3_9BACT|nr:MULTISPECIES: VWA domain-containing protein [unclassified Rubrivirga]MDT0632398.1 VWA domain-containing protein [Rubrivirga sp. F394]MDT7855231.1 VWA domain-containing protein [Rubrivirga sp. S365]